MSWSSRILDKYSEWYSYEEDLLGMGWCTHQKIVDVMKTIDDIDNLSKADIGCGTGLVGKEWGKKDIDGFDLVPTMCDLAQNSYANMRMHNIEEEPLHKKYDVVIMCGTFTDYILDASCLQNVSDSLEDDGVLITSIPFNTDYFNTSGWSKQEVFKLDKETLPFKSWIPTETEEQKVHRICTWRKK